MFYKNFHSTMQKILVSHSQGMAHTSLLECLVVPLTPFLGEALLRSSATLSLGLKMTISNVLSSLFSDLTC